MRGHLVNCLNGGDSGGARYSSQGDERRTHSSMASDGLRTVPGSESKSDAEKLAPTLNWQVSRPPMSGWAIGSSLRWLAFHRCWDRNSEPCAARLPSNGGSSHRPAPAGLPVPSRLMAAMPRGSKIAVCPAVVDRFPIRPADAGRRTVSPMPAVAVRPDPRLGLRCIPSRSSRRPVALTEDRP